MKTVKATAPGKAILFGEHAVVYHRPAIAVPVANLRAEATVQVVVASHDLGAYPMPKVSTVSLVRLRSPRYANAA